MKKDALHYLIAHLERPDPSDKNPGATKALVSYLRIMEACGVEEMALSQVSNVMALFASAITIAPTVEEAVQYVEEMVSTIAQQYRVSGAKAEALINSTKGTRK